MTEKKILTVQLNSKR